MPFLIFDSEHPAQLTRKFDFTEVQYSKQHQLAATLSFNLGLEIAQV